MPEPVSSQPLPTNFTNRKRSADGYWQQVTAVPALGNLLWQEVNGPTRPYRLSGDSDCISICRNEQPSRQARSNIAARVSRTFASAPDGRVLGFLALIYSVLRC